MCVRALQKAIFLLAMLGGSTLAAYGGEEEPEKRCQRAIAKAEREFNVPKHLLQAVALGESGRVLESGKTQAWPWTTHAEGQGHYLPTKAEAVAQVRQWLARGIKKIDVGCMQVNLLYHPKAFSSLEAAFDPQTNVTYAATFLLQLKQQLGSWEKAVAHYHSANEYLNRPYQDRIYKLWHAVQRKGLDDDEVSREAAFVLQAKGWALARSPFQRLTRAPFEGMKGKSLYQSKRQGEKRRDPAVKAPIDLDKLLVKDGAASFRQAVSRAEPVFFPLKKDKLIKPLKRGIVF